MLHCPLNYEVQTIFFGRLSSQFNIFAMSKHKHMHKQFFSIGFFLFLVSCLSAQKLPSQWILDADNHKVSIGSTSTGFYDESIVEEIRLYFTESNYWTLLTNNYNSKIDLMCKMVYKGETFDSIGVRFKGQTSYFMNTTQKKSFNISLDAFVDGQDIEGYNTFNLNNSFDDPSMMREVLYYNLIRPHTPAAKANFVNLYLNDQLWGVYQNVQQLNKDFLKEWYNENDGTNIRADVPAGTTTGGPGGGGGPGWGDGTAGFNYLGADTALYKKYYTLKSTDDPQPWVALRDATKVIKESTDLLNDAPKVLDIDKVLWHLASEIVFGDDDSYVFKGKMDYYLYQDEITKRWATYDYDANSTFVPGHSTWSPFYNASKVNYPLLNKLLAVPEFRQRFLAHMRTIVNTSMDVTKFNALVTKYDELIKAHVTADPKKISTIAKYNSELSVLKKFVSDRIAYLKTNSEYNVESPLFYTTGYVNDGELFKSPSKGQKTLLTSKVGHSTGISGVNAYISNTINEVFEKIALNDGGTNGDITAGDGIWSSEIDNPDAGASVFMFFEAVANNTAKTVAFYPAGAEHEMLVYTVKPEVNSAVTVVINEFMASNTGIIKDDNDETEDWIELYNTTNSAINLEGYHITDTETNLTKYTFPAGVSIAANGYLIVWADEDGLTQGPNHANFKLSASGEQIILLSPNQTELDRVVFGTQEANKSSARIPNGTGPFRIGEHTFNANNDGTVATSDNIKSIKIFPNPSNDIVYIDSENEEKINVYNMFGQLMYQGSGNSFNVSNWPRASYVVKIQGAGVVKLIVE